MKNKRIILLVMICITIGGMIGIKASELIESNQVIYKDNETVDVVLDNLYEELDDGKDKIAQAITDKGIEVSADDTLKQMADKINDSRIQNNMNEFLIPKMTSNSMTTGTVSASSVFPSGTYYAYCAFNDSCNWLTANNIISADLIFDFNDNYNIDYMTIKSGHTDSYISTAGKISIYVKTANSEEYTFVDEYEYTSDTYAFGLSVLKDNCNSIKIHIEGINGRYVSIGKVEAYGKRS